MAGNGNHINILFLTFISLLKCFRGRTCSLGTFFAFSDQLQKSRLVKSLIIHDHCIVNLQCQRHKLKPSIFPHLPCQIQTAVADNLITHVHPPEIISLPYIVLITTYYSIYFRYFNTRMITYRHSIYFSELPGISFCCASIYKSTPSPSCHIPTVSCSAKVVL